MNLPASSGGPHDRLPGPPIERPAEPDLTGVSLVDTWRIMVRRWRWVAGAALVAIAAAVWLLHTDVPSYEGVVTLRFDDAQPELPLLVGAGAGNQVTTEMEELRSRTLTESAARRLSLQIRLASPKGTPRATVLSQLAAVEDADSALYRLSVDTAGQYVVERVRDGVAVGTAALGTPVTVGGATFALLPGGAEYTPLEVQVQSLGAATELVRSATTVRRAGRDANIVHLRYRDTDPDLAWQVPNAIAAEFAERRRGLQQEGAASTIAFLRGQLDSISRQLATSEDALRRFRERERVISPQIEASTRVQRVVELESERARLDAERAALDQLVSAVEAAARTRDPEEPSPYRRLAAFPTLMRHEASTDVLQSLSALETQRRELLTRRTAADPEVQALTGRIEELERQLRTTAVTYLEGLGNQVSAIDASLGRFNRELAQLPRREVEYARLVRTPQVLEGISTMLQTRLKEAEISQAASDRAVRVVDPAAPSTAPAGSRRELIALATVFVGLLVGLGLAFTRELTDASLHTRADVQLVTGLPVLGLIPRIRGARGRIATVGRKTALTAAAESSRRVAAAAQAADAGPAYTFFGAAPPPRADAAVAGNGSNGSSGTALATVPAQAAALEAYGMLQTNLAFARPDEPAKIVVFTSAMPGDGKTTTAVNLAITLAMRGIRVLLMDTDLRKGRVHAALEVPREPGLSEFLQGTQSWEQTVRVTVVNERRELHYVTCGKPPHSPTGMLESPALRSMLSRLRSEYDTIILDSPPANLVTDAALLASIADGVLLVARSGVTDAEALAHGLDNLRYVGAKVLGVVLNDIDFRRDARYDRAYRFYDTSSYLGVEQAG